MQAMRKSRMPSEKEQPRQPDSSSTTPLGNYLATGSFLPVAEKSVPHSIQRNRILFFGFILAVILFTLSWLLAGF